MTKIENIYCVDINWINNKIKESDELIPIFREMGLTSSNNYADKLCEERDAFEKILEQLKPITPLIEDAFDEGEQSGMNSEFGRYTANDKQEYINTKEFEI